MTTPAGWYPDSGQPGQLRYWDGQAWTDHLMAMPPPPGESAAPPVTPPAPQAAEFEVQKWMKRNIEGRPDWMGDLTTVGLLAAEARDDIPLVGESFYQDALWYLVKDDFERGETVRHPVIAVLYPETDNPHDRNAISAWVDGWKVGYFSRDDAQAFRPSLDALIEREGRPMACHGVIVGGGQRSDGPGNLGVWLYYDPAELKRS